MIMNKENLVSNARVKNPQYIRRSTLQVCGCWTSPLAQTWYLPTHSADIFYII